MISTFHAKKFYGRFTFIIIFFEILIDPIDVLTLCYDSGRTVGYFPAKTLLDAIKMLPFCLEMIIFGRAQLEVDSHKKITWWVS